MKVKIEVVECIIIYYINELPEHICEALNYFKAFTESGNRSLQ